MSVLRTTIGIGCEIAIEDAMAPLSCDPRQAILADRNTIHPGREELTIGLSKRPIAAPRMKAAARLDRHGGTAGCYCRSIFF
jgi:hypothetical protein